VSISNFGNFAFVAGNADALGLSSVTFTATKTAAAPGIGFGMAAATASAEGGNGIAPLAIATTAGAAEGGNITSSHTGTFSIDFEYGPKPVSVAISLTFVSTHGFEPLGVNSLIHDAYSSLGSSILIS